MNIDYEKIKEIYGEEILDEIKSGEDARRFIENVRYMSLKNIECIDEIISSYFLIFLYDNEDFKIKLDNLIAKLGDNYIDIIANDIGVLEGLLW